MKTCNTCKTEKSFDQFSKRGTDGLQHKCKACAKAYRDATKSEQEARHAVWREANRDRLREWSRAWDKANPEKRAAASAKYQKSNKAYYAAHCAKRTAAKKLGYDSMDQSEKAEVEHLYWLARDLTAVSGEQYHVDHIKPLSKGGEHRLHNLQILSAEDNLRKGSKYGKSVRRLSTDRAAPVCSRGL